MENQEQELIDNTTVDVKGETIVFPAEWCFKFNDGINRFRIVLSK